MKYDNENSTKLLTCFYIKLVVSSNSDMLNHPALEFGVTLVFEKALKSLSTMTQ